MKKRNIILFSLFLAVGNATAQEWVKIKTEAYPGTRWWWMGSAVDSKNLTYNLEEYSKAGLKTVEITPIYGVKGNEKNELKYLSAPWMKMLQHTQQEAKRLGMEIDMNTGTGWPFGGPEVSIEDAASKALFQSFQVKGGEEVELDVRPADKERPYATLSRCMAYQKGKVVNLTSLVKDGKLKWNAPQGDWQIISLYVGKTRQKVKRAAPGGEGFVMDHLNKDAVKRYLAKYDKAFKEYKVTPPHTFFNDSYEVYGADWTPDLLEQFEKHRGYKLEDHFPEFIAQERTDKGARIVSDYRETMSEMLLENFSKQWTEWAHRHGSITRNQAHGSPANLIDVYGSVDIPEIEGFGLSQFHIKGLRQDSLTRKNDSDISMLKYASSAAHITGKPYTSSETFTWLTDHFRTSLSQCKPDFDLMMVSGVNHIFFHGTPYSPKEAKWPGWLFYATINMSPTNSIWRDAPAFFKYIARSQSFLQYGKPDNDFLLYLPVYDMWQEQPGRMLTFDIHGMYKKAPKFIKTVHDILHQGYDVDYISDSFILSTIYNKEKGLQTQGGSYYKALIVPAANLMPHDVLKHLLNLAQQGATIVFMEHYPADVPGYSKLETRRKLFQKIMSKIPNEKNTFADAKAIQFGKGKIIVGSDYNKTLALCSVASEEMKTKYGLQYIRRANDKGHHYFVSCLQSNDVQGWITLGVTAQEAMFFNPMNGEKGKAKVRQQNGKTQVYMQLKSGESMILQTFAPPMAVSVPQWEYMLEQPLSLSIDHGWTLRFVQSEPSMGKGTYSIDYPQSWTKLDAPNATKTMATGIYETEITLPDLKADNWILDLGDVRESARVRINGKDAGTAWAVPFRIKVGHLLQKGKNRIEVEVTNLPTNRIIDMDRNGVEWRIFKDTNIVSPEYKKNKYNNWAIMPSGLNSNVRLIPVTYIK